MSKKVEINLEAQDLLVISFNEELSLIAAVNDVGSRSNSTFTSGRCAVLVIKDECL